MKRFAAIALLALASLAASNDSVEIKGAVPHPLTLTRSNLAAMPRTKLTVTDPHSKQTNAYEGVLVSEILARAGAPQGEHLRGKALATSVVVEATDGYRVVYAIAELDPGTSSQNVLLADTMDGKPLPDGLGPFRLIAPADKRPARWVRMVKSLTIVSQ
jgi:DMSO/TMAO reductase YedYZ molybdopterin-dependent catalytic subunit